MNQVLRTVSLLIILPIASACTAAFEPETKTTPVVGDTVLSSLPSLSETMVKGVNVPYRSCLGRGADAAFSQSESSDVSIALISSGGGSDDADNSEDSGETEMAGRTPAVLMAREMFFRACEFSTNYGLTKDEALQIYLQTLSAVSKGWAAETEKLTINIGETLTVTDVDTTTDTTASKVDSATGATSTTQPTATK